MSDFYKDNLNVRKLCQELQLFFEKWATLRDTKNHNHTNGCGPYLEIRHFNVANLLKISTFAT